MECRARIDYQHEAARARCWQREQDRHRRLNRLLVLLWLGLMFLAGFGVGRADGAQQTPRFSTEIVQELACLQLQVRPQIMLPLTRTDLHVEARVRRHAHHAQLSIAWDGGLAGAGGSAQTLHGDDEPALVVRTLRDKPAATWQFVAAVFDRSGKLTGRDVASIRMPEIE
jgi:hypothetical protein